MIKKTSKLGKLTEIRLVNLQCFLKGKAKRFKHCKEYINITLRDSYCKSKAFSVAAKLNLKPEALKGFCKHVVCRETVPAEPTNQPTN